MAPKARILAIDDQLYFRSFLEGLLAEAGHSVATASGCDEGLDQLRSGRFDLVIVDPALPDRDPIEVLRELRGAPAEPRLLVLSGAGEAAAIVAAMHEGVVDYLLKPIEREALLQAIDAALAQKTPQRCDDQRLVDENLQFMGRLALHERAVPLLAASDLASAAPGVLELLAAEAGAREAQLFMRPPDGGELVLQAQLPGPLPEGPAPVWHTDDADLAERLQAGEIVCTESADGASADDGAITRVPLLEGGQLLGVACLAGRGEPGLAGLRTAQKLAGALLGNARRFSQLSSARLRDPLTGLPTRAFLEAVLEVEVAKAQRFGRRLACVCVDPRGLDAEPAHVRERVVAAMDRTLRNTDILCSEDGRRFWVLVTNTDALGGVVLKRRLSERIDDALSETGTSLALAVGVASFPLDGELRDELLDKALARVEGDRASVVRRLGLDKAGSLGEVGSMLLSRAERMPARLVPEAAEFMVSELACRPRDRGLLFLAPGPDGLSVIPPLSALGDVEIATDVFLATDGDTVPCGALVTAVGLPANISPQETWIVRFGEGTPYALVAGPGAADGTRPVFHSDDPGLVEDLAFRLRAEVGFGVRS